MADVNSDLIYELLKKMHVRDRRRSWHDRPNQT